MSETLADEKASVQSCERNEDVQDKRPVRVSDTVVPRASGVQVV